MIYGPEKKYGIDAEIYKIQQAIHSGIGIDTGFDVYGQIMRKYKDGRIRFESLVSSTEYREVLVDDTKKGVVAFWVKESREGMPQKIADVDIIFTVNLVQMIGGYFGEKMLLVVEDILNSQGYQALKIKTGVQEVFKEVDRDRFLYSDMSPYFVFSFSLKLPYFDNMCEIP